MFQRFTPYFGEEGQPTPCPSWWADVWRGTQSYLPLPPVSTPTTSAPKALTSTTNPPTTAPVLVDREIGSPEIASGGDRAAWVAPARSVCVAIPMGATRYEVTFSPASPASAYCGVLNVAPVGLEEPASGTLDARLAELRVTPIWARLSDESVSANSARATLRIQFT